VLVTVLRVSRSCERFPDGFDIHLLHPHGYGVEGCEQRCGPSALRSGPSQGYSSSHFPPEAGRIRPEWRQNPPETCKANLTIRCTSKGGLVGETHHGAVGVDVGEPHIALICTTRHRVLASTSTKGPETVDTIYVYTYTYTYTYIYTYICIYTYIYIYIFIFIYIYIYMCVCVCVCVCVYSVLSVGAHRPWRVGCGYGGRLRICPDIQAGTCSC